MSNLLKICFIAVVAGLVAVYILKLPLNSVLFFGFLLACPLMHFAMGHGSEDKKSPKHH